MRVQKTRCASGMAVYLRPAHSRLARAFAIGPETSVVRGTQKVRVEDVRAGERVVVHAERDGGKLRATELRLAPAAGASGGRKKR